MNADELRYWLQLIISLPLAVIWFGVVGVLSWLTTAGGSSRTLRWLAHGSVTVCGLVTALLALLLAWRPDWYRDWITAVIVLVMFLCFGVSLNALIWRKNPPKTPEERRLRIGGTVYFNTLTLAVLAASLIYTEWLNLLFLIRYGMLIALGCVYMHRAQQRLQNHHEPGHA